MTQRTSKRLDGNDGRKCKDKWTANKIPIKRIHIKEPIEIDVNEIELYYYM